MRSPLRDYCALDGCPTARTWLAGPPIHIEVIQVMTRLIEGIAMAAKGGAAVLDAQAQRLLYGGMQRANLRLR